MKILIASLSNIGGGASKVASNLHMYLNNQGIDSEHVIFSGKPGEKVTILLDTKLKKMIFRIKNKFVQTIFLFFRNLSKDYQSINIFPSKMLRYINNSDADIVQLHWVGAEMISVKQIGKINKKIIWTMHDAWALNGSCHISPTDYIAEDAISNTTDKNLMNVLDGITLKRKIKYIANKEIVFTSPSIWLKEKYEVSFYDKEKTRCVVIPNFIDLARWKPIEKGIARSKLKIKTSKILLTFGANNATKSFNKGYHFIKELMNLLPPEKYGFLIFGNEDEQINWNVDFEVFNFGKIFNEDILRTVYSAGDITIVPSMSESFSLVSLESLSCNTPVLAFNSSGIRDLVIHKQNGYLARKFEIEDLLTGVVWLTENRFEDLRSTICKFSKEIVLQQYVNLYHELESNK